MVSMAPTLGGSGAGSHTLPCLSPAGSGYRPETSRILGRMDGQSSLGAFLQARRSRLRPEDIGLDTYGERRRVQGLRREELALLAGVSASYYARLEQGHAHHASPRCWTPSPTP